MRAVLNKQISLSFILLASLASTSVSAQTNEVGINGHNAEPAVLDMATDLGLGWIRVDGNWFQMEPRRGEYRWGLDDAVRGASSRGLNVYISLGYTPEWVARVPGSDGLTHNDEPVSSSEWRSFVTQAVRHYRALGVTHFGIWNEPNLDNFFEGGVDAYIDKILIPGSEAVRAECGDCLVLGPDLAHVGPYHEYLDPIMRRAGDRFDILAHHIYSGFPELGTSVFDGDNFMQALEMRRFSFTRPSLREILDDNGWTGEVWITETGFQARSIGDPGNEAEQATYVRRVLEEQLTRDWWTNTFFYEALDCGIDIPDCDIDGFGITRPDRSPPRSFPEHFRTKPAYDELRTFISTHPELGPGGSEPPPPVDTRLELEVMHKDGVIADGSLGDWAGVPTVRLETWDGDVAYGGRDDLSVTARFAYRDGALFVAVEVTDDAHDNTRDGDTLWAGDSLQLAIDVDGDGGAGYDEDDHELTIALAGGEIHVRREHGDGATPTAAVVRMGTRTVYEVVLPAAALPGAVLEAGGELRASLVVNDSDGAGRQGWLELTEGIARGKMPERFARLSFLEAGIVPEPPATSDGGVGGPDGGGGTVGDDGGVITGDGGVGMPPLTPPTGTPDPGAGGCNATGTNSTPLFAAISLLALLLARRRRR